MERVSLRVQAVLLDMDGTGVDSTAVVDRRWSEWADRNGLNPLDVLRVTHGRQAATTMAHFLPERSPEEIMAESEDMLARETAETEGVVPIFGAPELLHALRDVPHALVTSASAALAAARMDAAGLSVPEVAVTSENVSASKPDPEGFLLAAAALRVSPENCLVFEDSDVGIRAAQAAGMPVVGVGSSDAAISAGWSVRDLTEVSVSADPDGLTVQFLIDRDAG